MARGSEGRTVVASARWPYLVVVVGDGTLSVDISESLERFVGTTGIRAFSTTLARGTLPVLALISFSSFSVEHSPRKGVFFKTAGLIVILFALFNIINALVAAGIVPPIFNL